MEFRDNVHTETECKADDQERVRLIRGWRNEILQNATVHYRPASTVGEEEKDTGNVDASPSQKYRTVAEIYEV